MVYLKTLAALCLTVVACATAQAQKLDVDKQGLRLLDADARVLDSVAVRSKRWDQRTLPDGSPIALLHDADNGELLLVRGQGSRLKTLARWSGPAFNLEALCLHRDGQNLLHAFLLADDGLSEQWLLPEAGGAAPARPLRRLATPIDAKTCRVRDADGQLFIAEPKVGIWAYATDAERSQRELVLHDPAIDTKRLDAWLAQQPQRPLAHLPFVQAVAQTDTVKGQGDAADDPAIWVHPRNSSHSLVLGTDKKRGLAVYDLQGKERQFLPVGRINNVDLRQNLRYGPHRFDLAAATQRDENSIVLFGISPQGQVSELARLPTDLADIYGICTGRNADGQLDVFANDKDGRVLQLRVLNPSGKPGAWTAQVVRRTQLASQPEGCVVDESTQSLFVGEEKRGVWRISLKDSDSAEPELIVPVGGALHADVEGLAIYRGKREHYLVVSSQGNDSYLVLDATPPYALRGAFRVGINTKAGIDGTSETDGLDVTAVALGGPYGEGMLVVQDGHKRMPQGTQNFKLVPWSAVAESFRLP
ncbi:MAG: phytase [Pseudomonadota bacterium]